MTINRKSWENVRVWAVQIGLFSNKWCWLRLSVQRQLWATTGNVDSHILVLQILLIGILFDFLGPPELKVKPYDTTTNSGDSLVMNCVAEGEPTPTITWRKASIILQNGLLERVAILNNDSLRYLLPPTYSFQVLYFGMKIFVLIINVNGIVGITYIWA